MEISKVDIATLYNLGGVVARHIIVSILEQPWNAFISIFRTFFPIVMRESDLHP